MGKKISICFFGITRNLRKTYPSIKNNIIDPAKKLAEVKIFCHFFEIKSINNSRSKEFNIKTENNWNLFEDSKIISDPPDLLFKEINLDYIYKFGDRYKDDFKSIKNLIHQLTSIQKVFKISKSFNSDLTIFARPDLLYLDSFEEIIKKNLFSQDEFITIPSWLGTAGLNDRFSICNSCHSAEIYANRIERINENLEYSKQGLAGEHLLYYVIKNSNSKIKFMDLRAKRIRANNNVVEESFKKDFLNKLKEISINEKNKFKRFIIGLMIFYFYYFKNKYLKFIKIIYPFFRRIFLKKINK